MALWCWHRTMLSCSMRHDVSTTADRVLTDSSTAGSTHRPKKEKKKKSASPRLTREASHTEVRAETLLLIKGQLAFTRQMLIVTESSFKNRTSLCFYGRKPLKSQPVTKDSHTKFLLNKYYCLNRLYRQVFRCRFAYLYLHRLMWHRMYYIDTKNIKHNLGEFQVFLKEVSWVLLSFLSICTFN